VDLSADISQALLRNQTKEEVALLLARLTPSDRKAVLLDLITEGADKRQGVALAPVTPAAPVAAPPEPRARTFHLPAKKPAGRPKAPTGLATTLLELVKQKPGAPIREHAEALYGDGGKHGQDKTRSLLAALKKQGLANNPESGKWEAVE
jgi:hypothetical protein